MSRITKKSVSASGVTKKIQALPGALDVITDADPAWDVLLRKFERFSRNFGFSKVDVPFIEDAQVFSGFVKPEEKLVGVMLGNKEAALRASFLPQVIRAYAALKEPKALSKWAFSGQTVRLDAKDHILTDYQFGFEVFGGFTHLTEAQVIGAVWEMVASVGLGNVVLEINTTGLPDCQRQYQATLTDFLKARKYALCDSCVELLTDTSMQILRCTELDCQAIVSEAPVILDFLESDSRTYFTNILEALEELQIPYQLNPLYVGTAGATKTNFAIRYKDKNSNVVIGEGSYHTEIASRLTGKAHPAFGFLGNLTKLHEMLKREQVEIQIEHKNEVYLVPLGELAAKKSLRLFRDLISAKIRVYDHFGNTGVKSQLKAAQDSQSPIALIMGQKEAVDEMVILRDVKSGMQEMFHYEKIVDEVKKRLGK